MSEVLFSSLGLFLVGWAGGWYACYQFVLKPQGVEVSALRHVRARLVEFESAD